jgi:hypothetical protein
MIPLNRTRRIGLASPSFAVFLATRSRLAVPVVTDEPATLGAFLEVTWQHQHALGRRESEASRLDFDRWLDRRPPLDGPDAGPVSGPILGGDSPTGHRPVDGQGAKKGWASGGTVRKHGGWPVAFGSRGQAFSKRDRREIQWLADAAGLRLMWSGEGDDERALLALPGSRVKEFVDFDTIVAM